MGLAEATPLDDGPALPFEVLGTTLRLLIRGETSSSNSTVVVRFWAVCRVFLPWLLGSEDIAAYCCIWKGEVGGTSKLANCWNELSQCADKMS